MDVLSEEGSIVTTLNLHQLIDVFDDLLPDTIPGQQPPLPPFKLTRTDKFPHKGGAGNL
jgi:hypothetical protein